MRFSRGLRFSLTKPTTTAAPSTISTTTTTVPRSYSQAATTNLPPPATTTNPSTPTQPQPVPITLQYLSDLHLELSSQYTIHTIPPHSPYLLLAGDIGRLTDTTPLLTFLHKASHNFQKIFYVLGNHEFYGTSRAEGLSIAEGLCKEPALQGKVTLLERTRVDLSEEVTLLGCTLQSYITPESEEVIRRRVNDFRRIEGWTVETHNEAHAVDLAWLRASVERIAREEPKRRIVVVTHHAPSHMGTSAPEHFRSDISSAFCTPVLEEQIGGWEGKGGQIRAWVFGHTHWSMRGSVAGVELYSNQRGYVFDGVSEIERRAKRLAARKHEEEESGKGKKPLAEWIGRLGKKVEVEVAGNGDQGVDYDVGACITV